MEIEVHVLLICGVTYNIEFQVHTRDDFWEYMFRGLIPTLYPERNVYGRQMTSKTQTADLLNHRIGSLRLRQIRITNSNYVLQLFYQFCFQQNVVLWMLYTCWWWLNDDSYVSDSCQVPSEMSSIISSCHAEYDFNHVDSRNYDGSWQVLASSDELSPDSSHWQFQHRGDIHSKPVYGRNKIYIGSDKHALLR